MSGNEILRELSRMGRSVEIITTIDTLINQEEDLFAISQGGHPS
jgi:hypothetical protein